MLALALLRSSDVFRAGGGLSFGSLWLRFGWRCDSEFWLCVWVGVCAVATFFRAVVAGRFGGLRCVFWCGGLLACRTLF